MRRYLFSILTILYFAMFFVTNNFICFGKDTRALSTSDIIELVNSGISEDVVIKYIETSKTKFNLSPQDLIKLKKADVPSQVIKAMVESVSDQSTEAQTGETERSLPKHRFHFEDTKAQEMIKAFQSSSPRIVKPFTAEELQMLHYRGYVIRQLSPDACHAFVVDDDGKWTFIQGLQKDSIEKDLEELGLDLNATSSEHFPPLSTHITQNTGTGTLKVKVRRADVADKGGAFILLGERELILYIDDEYQGKLKWGQTFVRENLKAGAHVAELRDVAKTLLGLSKHESKAVAHFQILPGEDTVLHVGGEKPDFKYVKER